MRIYATKEQLAPMWLDEAPPNADRLLMFASLTIENATRLDVYAVDNEGYPTDPRIKEAFTNATLAQAAFWHGADIDPAKGAVGQQSRISSQSVPGGSVSYNAPVTTAELGAAAVTACQAAVNILRAAGLMRAHVRPL